MLSGLTAGSYLVVFHIDPENSLYILILYEMVELNCCRMDGEHCLLKQFVSLFGCSVYFSKCCKRLSST